VDRGRSDSSRTDSTLRGHGSEKRTSGAGWMMSDTLMVALGQRGPHAALNVLVLSEQLHANR